MAGEVDVQKVSVLGKSLRQNFLGGFDFGFGFDFGVGVGSDLRLGFDFDFGVVIDGSRGIWLRLFSVTLALRVRVGVRARFARNVTAHDDAITLKFIRIGHRWLLATRSRQSLSGAHSHGQVKR
jgi:hypothetical protein